MRKYLLLVLAVCTFAVGNAQQARDPRPVSTEHPFSFISQEDQRKLYEQIPESAKKAQRPAPKKALRRVEGAVDTIQYTAIAQDHKRGGRYNVNGGDVAFYSIGIARDGNKVTFSNFFNLAESTASSWAPDVDYTFDGVYDEAAKTITVPASTVFENATQVGYIMQYYIGTLAVGHMNDDGTLAPDDNLVFQVEGDFERLTTTQVVSITQWMPSGSSSYGLYKAYRNLIITLPKEGAPAEIVCFNDNLPLGEVFNGYGAATDSIPLVNIGGTEADFAVEVESDPEGYITSTTAGGTLAPYSATNITFALAGAEPADEVEAIASINYEAGDKEDSYLVSLTGRVKALPDYSVIVKNGDFSFDTTPDYPYEIVDYLGETAVHSGCQGYYATSDLWVRFSVPEGKLGKFTFNGYYQNDMSFRYWYMMYGGYFVDSEYADYATSSDGDFNGTIELAPGEHFVRFQHQASYYSGIAANGIYLTSLDLQFEDLPADAAELKTASLDFGSFIVEDGYDVSGTQNIEIQNRGANDLTITSATSDNAEFTIDTNVEPVKSLAVLTLPVSFSSKTAGNKSGNITVTTNAGTYTIPVKAKVIDMPDFSQVITEGLEYIDVSTNPNAPFVVENGVAYNLNWDSEDTTPLTSALNLDINIPEGKIGYLTWEGKMWGAPLTDNWEDYWYADRAVFDYQCNNTSGYVNCWATDNENGTDAGSSYFTTYSDGFYANFLTFIPPTMDYFGNHLYFQYVNDGDGKTYGKNRLEVSNIRLHVEDFAEHAVQLVTEGVVEFDSTYVGPQRYTTATVTLKNIGSAVLSIDSIAAETPGAPFYGIVPDGWNNQVQFNNTMNVTLWFYPGEAVETDQVYEGNIIIYTTGGEVKVPVKGVARGSQGIVFVGDFEDDAYGWSTIDADGDGNSWNLGTNMWGDRPTYVRNGRQCLASASSDPYYGPLLPDNWTFSPAITIPADGAVLSFYASAFHPTQYAEHYSFYILDEIPASAADVQTIATDNTPLVEETIDIPADYDETGKVGGWKYHEIDLADYAGKTVYLVFRHHDCSGEYLLRIDDLFIRERENSLPGPLAIGGISADQVQSREYYNAAGQRVDAPQNGINVVRYKLNDGTTQTYKFVVK